MITTAFLGALSPSHSKFCRCGLDPPRFSLSIRIAMCQFNRVSRRQAGYA